MPPEDSPPKKSPPSPGKEEDWGEDWESAFQAEEDMFFADEDSGEDNFFLEESEEAGTVAGTETATPPPKKEPKAATQKTSPELSIAGTPGTLSFQTVLAMLKVFILQKLARPIEIVKSLFAKVQAFPLSLKIPAYCLPIFIFGIALWGYFSLQSPDMPTETASIPSEIDKRSDIEAEQPSSEEPIVQVYPDSSRTKWAFPGFIIPVKNESGDKSLSFLLVDITLVTVLAGDESPPHDKENFLRDTIYQFYMNRPQDELRYFSLARGEMNRKLKAWIVKQWPDAPIESIIFTRYFFS